MPKFSANLSFLWPELEPLERFRAAAKAGFGQVEFLFPQELDGLALARRLDETGLELVLFDAWPGDHRQGERGYLSLPGKEDELLRTADEALELAGRFGTKRLNVLGGMLPAGLESERAKATAVANLQRIAPLAQAAGVILLLENINSADAPGYAFPTIASAAAVVDAVDHPAVGMQMDQYHVSMAGGDPITEYRRHRDQVRHIQMADVPGRHQPGTGRAPLIAFLNELDGDGYDGFVGLEYHPLGATEDALAWLDEL